MTTAEAEPRTRGGATVVLVWWLRRPLWLRAAACVAACAAIWLSSSLAGRGGPSPLWKSFSNNAAHVVVFGVLAALFWSLRGLPARAGRGAWIAFAATVAYGLVDELHQSTVPHRDASAYDLLSDASGALLGIGFVLWIRRGWQVARRRVLIGALGALVSVPLATLG